MLILLDEYWRGPGDDDARQRARAERPRALAWIDRYGDRDGDGYVEYRRRYPRAAWSTRAGRTRWNSMPFADGDARRTADRDVRDPGLRLRREASDAPAGRARCGATPSSPRACEREAAALFDAVQRGLLDARARRATPLALDGDKRHVDSSDLEHRPPAVVAASCPTTRGAGSSRGSYGEALFSGWGVRTMAPDEAGYNPVMYHDGTVWPHDNSLIGAGLARYGYRARRAASPRP